MQIIPYPHENMHQLRSLERVPETGRWRFMDSLTASIEASAVRSELEQMKHQYSDRILPPNHPIARHIRRTVQAILEANNLGVVKGDPNANRVFSILPGLGAEDSWDPDANMTDTRTKEGSHFESNTREWELIVINDKETVNAAALPGENSHLTPVGLIIIEKKSRCYYCLYWHPSSGQRCARACGCVGSR